MNVLKKRSNEPFTYETNKSEHCSVYAQLAYSYVRVFHVEKKDLKLASINVGKARYNRQLYSFVRDLSI